MNYLSHGSWTYDCVVSIYIAIYLKIDIIKINNTYIATYIINVL